MAEKSNIGWTNATWNPVSGCSEVSPGCDNCYARVLTERWGRSFDVTLKPHKLGEPAKYKQPSLVFVNSMSDLFHREIPDDYLRQVWWVMLTNPQHVYQILTKRPHRMAHKIKTLGLATPEHIWLGVSAENQQMVDSRIPALLETGAPVKWLSCEPLLGPLDLRLDMAGIDWVIAGGESGAGRRPANLDWFRSLRNQCQMAGVPFYLKQGNHHRPGLDRLLDGRTWDEYPAVEHPALNRPALAQAGSGRMGI